MNYELGDLEGCEGGEGMQFIVFFNYEIRLVTLPKQGTT